MVRIRLSLMSGINPLFADSYLGEVQNSAVSNK